MKPSRKTFLGFLIVNIIIAVARAQEATRSPEIDAATLKEDFGKLDINNDGYVDVHEMRTIMPGVAEDDIGAFFDRYDADRDGVLTLEEYLTVSSSK